MPVRVTDWSAVQVDPPFHDSWAQTAVVPPLLFMPEIGSDADALDGGHGPGQAGREPPEPVAVLQRIGRGAGPARLRPAGAAGGVGRVR